MISVEQADQILGDHLWGSVPERVSMVDALGRVLAEDVLADRDFPPFNRVAMDGVAVCFDSIEEGQTEFKIAALVAAGTPEISLEQKAAAIEVMTGAVLPSGADTVIPYEHLKVGDGSVEVIQKPEKRWVNVHRCGIDAHGGAKLLNRGSFISTAEVPVLASVGLDMVSVQSLPRVAIVSTGDELVEPKITPAPHQIRRSNVYAISSALSRLNIKSTLIHFGDSELGLQGKLTALFEANDVLIFTGGVSKGKFDWVPAALGDAHIACHFHGVAQRPAKPLWFGSGEGKTVFAFPGNPVSSYLCVYRYFLPWLFMSMGAERLIEKAVLAEDFDFKAPLTYFLQVKLERSSGVLSARPIPGGGSGDFINLIKADGFLELPAGSGKFKKGEVFDFYGFRF
ncbi:MAG: molybdopterin molybdotransferase MoeA [Bacteroidetes bacterium]|nr:molybdopterin molybdotransferase MoeA [Bacteroidota bacterium]